MPFQNHTELFDIRDHFLSPEADSQKLGQLNWPLVNCLLDEGPTETHVQSLLWVVNWCWEQLVLLTHHFKEDKAPT